MTRHDNQESETREMLEVKASNGRSKTNGNGRTPTTSNGHASNGHTANAAPANGKDAKGADEEVDLRYGWGKFKAPCLQFFNKACWLLLFISLGNAVQSMLVNGFIGVSLSTIEKRFTLTSKQSSWIGSSYDIGTIPAVMIFSYFGTRVNRPRTIGFGFLGLTFGCLLYGSAHFTTPDYQPISNLVDDSCSLNRTGLDKCTLGEVAPNPGSSISNYLGVFIAAQLIHGFCATPVFTLGITALDDSVDTHTFSFYIGIFYALGVVGPAFAAFGSYFLLGLYTEFMTKLPSEITTQPGDPRWVGAWWIGFIISAIMCMLTAIPLTGFASELPDTAEVRKRKKIASKEAFKKNRSKSNDPVTIEEDEGDDEVGNTETVDLTNLKELPHQLKYLLSNPTYVCLTLFKCCDEFIIGGVAIFGPKVLEYQFYLKPGMAGAMFGAVLLPAGAFGTILGGLIIKKLKLTCRSIMRWELAMAAVTCCSLLTFIATCPNLPFDQLTPSTQADNPDLTSTCNTGCGCDTLDFNPVCGQDGVQYYSPCHAGCLNRSDMHPGKLPMYYECSCIGNITQSAKEYSPLKPYYTSPNVSIPNAYSGACSVEVCYKMPIFLIGFFIASLLIFANNPMNISATVRSIPNEHRSIGIGIQWIAIRVFGSIPGPFIFGIAFDGACRMWSKGEDCQRGACLYYDNGKIGLYLLAVCFTVKAISFVLMAVAWRCYRPSRATAKRSFVKNRPARLSQDLAKAEAVGAGAASTPDVEKEDENEALLETRRQANEDAVTFGVEPYYPENNVSQA